MKYPLICGALALSLALPLLGSADDHDIIAKRQDLMSNTREALKPLIGMSRGEVEFDAVTVAESLAVFGNTAEKAGDMFPPGSETGGDTEARATIWTDRDGFNEKLADFGDAVAKAQAAGIDSVDALKPQLQSVLGTCKGCHDDYRVDKD